MGKLLLHRREEIILTAIELIHERGIQGLSTREIAKRQGISEGTIFKHFKSKNDLLIAVLEKYSQYDADIIQSVRLKGLKPREAIIYFINAYAEYYENYPEVTAILQAYDVISCDPQLEALIKKIFFGCTSFLTDTIEDAKKSGEIASYVDSSRLTHVMMGFIREICLHWRLSGYQFELKERILSTLHMALKAFAS